MTLRYSPFDDTPTAATVALPTTGGVSILICKNILFVSTLPLAVRGRGDTPPVVKASAAAVRVSLHGL